MRSFDLTLAAEDDLTGIWLYTHKTWGQSQAETYFDQIVACCESIGDATAKSKAVKGLSDDIHVYRCQHHYIFFMPEKRPVILAILHERMDLLQRLRARLDG